jgi:hypothetical protein
MQFLSKNRFWVGCVIATLAFIVMFYLASNKLASDRNTFTNEIMTSVQTVDKILKTGADVGAENKAVVAHPNDVTKQGMASELTTTMDSLAQAWKLRRSQQESVLKWPTTVFANPLVLQTLSQFDPPEKFTTIDQGRLLSFLDAYREQIPNRMPEICGIVGARWEFGKEVPKQVAENGRDQSSQNPTINPGGIDNDLNRVVVHWDKKNQELWRDKLTIFEGIDGNKTKTPTAYQVLALQQDLWLLEAMFDIVKKVNGTADANDLAAVKNIHYVVFGREARTKLGKVSAPNQKWAKSGAAATAAAATQRGGAPDEDDFRGGGGGPTNSSDPFAGQTKAFDANPPEALAQMAPFHGRYVDQNFDPISIADLQTALSNPALPDTLLEAVVAKRVPVRIAVKMDETKIKQFIAECAASPFAFEIFQVRINRDVTGDDIKLAGGSKRSSGQGDSDRNSPVIGTGGQAAGGGSGSGVVGDDPGGGTGAGADSASARKVEAIDTRTTFDVNVEFYGIVKIYNPVDEQRIRQLIEKESGNTITNRPNNGPVENSVVSR